MSFHRQEFVRRDADDLKSKSDEKRGAPVILGCGSSEAFPTTSKFNIHDSVSSHLLLTAEVIEIHDKILETLSPENFDIFCGPTSTAILTKSGILVVWGFKSLIEQEYLNAQSIELLGICCGDGCYFCGVQYCSLGYDYMLILFRSGDVVGLGNDTNFRCTSAKAPLPFLLASRRNCMQVIHETALDIHAVTISNSCQLNYAGWEFGIVNKVIASLQFSVAVLENVIFVWGNRKYSYISNGSIYESTTAAASESYNSFVCNYWSVPPDACIIDVAAGTKHIIVLDSSNRIWTYGCNKYGALGRIYVGYDHSFQQVQLAGGYDWFKVSCGWTFSVFYGRNQGNDMFAAAGRSDFGQYPRHDGENSSIFCFDLLPNGCQIRYIWCGSEHTLAVGDDGTLWGRGWNDHGNLGNGGNDTFTRIWTPVIHGGYHLRITSNYSHVGTGGSHSIFVIF